MSGSGERLHRLVKSLVPEDLDVCQASSHFLARSAGRFLEEAVELALVFGLSAGGVLGHVADALHNEARKAKCFPSELPPGGSERERIVELADCLILIDYLRHCARIESVAVVTEADRKCAELEARAAAGEAVVVDCLMYKRSARG